MSGAFGNLISLAHPEFTGAFFHSNTGKSTSCCYRNIFLLVQQNNKNFISDSSRPYLSVCDCRVQLVKNLWYFSCPSANLLTLDFLFSTCGNASSPNPHCFQMHCQSVNNAKDTFKIQIPLHHHFACGITSYKICFPLQLESEMVFRFMSQQVMRQQAFNHLFPISQLVPTSKIKLKNYSISCRSFAFNKARLTCVGCCQYHIMPMTEEGNDLACQTQ